MGNTPTPNNAQSNIGCAYLAKVLQGTKREVDSRVEIECSATREEYDLWRRGLQSYKDKIERAFPDQADTILNSLLFPSSTLYDQNGSVCGDKQGKVILQFSSGFLTLEESKALHIQENMPYTSSQIWNLLLSMFEFDLMIKRTCLPLEVRTESLYTDLRTKHVKLRNPFTLFGSEFKYRHEKYMDTEKLGLVIRGMKVPREIEEQNEAFNIGMILVEIMLLESVCTIYDDGLSYHKSINPTLHEMLVQKVLKLAYYPLKLRMVVSGLIQLNPSDRLSTEEVYSLLSEFKQKIKNFHTFHLRKTAFQNIFKFKLNALDVSIDRIKQETNAELFKDGIPFTSASENKSHYKQVPYNPLVNSFHKHSAHNDVPSGHMDHSLNFSITNLGNTHRHGDLQSLNLSKSDNKSFFLQEKSSAKEKSVVNSSIVHNTDSIKRSDKSVGSLPMTVAAPVVSNQLSLDRLQPPPPLAIPHISTYSQPPPEITRIADQEITNPFEDFQPERKSIQSNEGSKLSNKTPPRPPPQEKSERQSNSLKVQEENSSLPLKDLITPDLRLSANLQLIQTQKKITVGKDHEQDSEQNISCIPQDDKSHSQNGNSRNSSVVEYVSELYQTERVMDPPLETTQPQKVASPPRQERQSWETEKLFDSSQPRRLFIKKTESYEIQSNSYSSIQPPREVVHQASIIDRLAPLVKSKKTVEETYKPDNLTDSAKKRIEYWNTFSKFSPEVIAQLHLPAKYPETERLKRSMRETISYHNVAMGRTKKMFPQGQSQRDSLEDGQKSESD